MKKGYGVIMCWDNEEGQPADGKTRPDGSPIQEAGNTEDSFEMVQRKPKKGGENNLGGKKNSVLGVISSRG